MDTKNNLIIMKTCEVCGRGPQSAYNRPNSQHKTKKTVYLNLQKKNGKMMCTKCIKTLSR